MKLIRWSSLLLYALFIFFLSTRPAGGMELFEHADKIIHFIFYAIMAALSAWVLSSTDFPERPREFFFGSVLMASSYGAFIELVQGSLSYRSAELGDIMANTIGAMVGAFFFLLFLKSRGIIKR